MCFLVYLSVYLAISFVWIEYSFWNFLVTSLALSVCQCCCLKSHHIAHVIIGSRTLGYLYLIVIRLSGEVEDRHSPAGTVGLEVDHVKTDPPL